MKFNTAKFVLASVWYIGGFAIFGILVYFQSQGFMNDSDVKQGYWGWFGSNVMPMMTLITTTLIFSDEEKTLNRSLTFIFFIGIIISVLYLSLIGFLLIYSRNFLDNLEIQNLTPYEFITESNFYLAIIQSIYSVILGYFFFKPKESEPEK